MASDAELRLLKTLPVPQAEVKFLQLMTRHHQGALHMIPPTLQPGVLPQVRHLARQMQVVQGGEIRFMTSLLRGRGADLTWITACECQHQDGGLRDSSGCIMVPPVFDVFSSGCHGQPIHDPRCRPRGRGFDRHR